MKNYKIGIIIVLYNKKIEETNIINNIEKYRDSILIFDNTPYDIGNRTFCIDNNIYYRTETANIGISKAFNNIIKDNIELFDYFLLLDDDSEISSELIEELNSQVEEYDVLLPSIISKFDNNKYSPIVKANGEVTAINSGAIIKSSVFKNHLFNEKYFLYFVDSDFFRNLSKELKILEMKTILYHDFSGMQKNYSDAIHNQTKLLFNDAKKYFPNMIRYFIYKMRIIFKYFKRYKKMRILYLIFY